MTPMEILHKIVEVEQEAQEIFNEAVRRQEGFSDYLEAKKAKIHETYYKVAEAEIEKARQERENAANERIIQSDKKLEVELNSARQAFVLNKEKYVQQIFDMVVGRNV